METPPQQTLTLTLLVFVFSWVDIGRFLSTSQYCDITTMWLISGRVEPGPTLITMIQEQHQYQSAHLLSPAAAQDSSCGLSLETPSRWAFLSRDRKSQCYLVSGSWTFKIRAQGLSDSLIVSPQTDESKLYLVVLWVMLYVCTKMCTFISTFLSIWLLYCLLYQSQCCPTLLWTYYSKNKTCSLSPATSRRIKLFNVEKTHQVLCSQGEKNLFQVLSWNIKRKKF